jgi:CDP-6-deoxy-D-xylo-4-hexulose-3-dehydrase
MNSRQLEKASIRAKINQLVEQYAEIEFEPQEFIPGTTAVPPSGKKIGAQELKNMVEASLDAWLTSGRFNDLFEKKLAQFIGVNHLITVNSGSSANLVAFSTLTSSKLGTRAIKKGDEVIGVAAGLPTILMQIKLKQP